VILECFLFFLFFFFLSQEKFQDAKGVIRIRKSKEEQATQWPNEKGQNDKQRSTKHYTEN
jgi:hypothetical protein